MRNLTDVGMLIMAVGAVCVIVDWLAPFVIRRLS